MVTGLIRPVNHFPEANQIRDKASGASVDVYSLVAIEKVTKQLILPLIRLMAAWSLG